MIYLYIKSLLSFRFYHRLAFAARRHIVLYALFLFALSVLMVYFAAGSYASKNIPLLIRNFPEITFEKGVLTAPDKPVSVQIPHTPFNITFDASAQSVPANQQLADAQTLAWINKNTIYVPSSRQLQQRTIPADFSFTASQENLNKEKDFLISAVRITLVTFSFFMIPLIMLVSFIMASCVGFAFKIWTGCSVPNKVVFKWAFFLLGPLSVLWYVRLWIPIPLFVLASTILCIIYMQQIFNLMEIHR